MPVPPRSVHLARSKLVPPTLHAGTIPRPRLFERFSADAPFTLVSAMPGFGKTIAVRQWIDTLDGAVAWLSLDVLDEEPVTFWAHLIASLREAVPTLDDEPGLLLEERGTDDRLFLLALIAQLSSIASPVLVVLDGVAHQLHRRTLDAVVVLVDRCDGRVRLLVTAQSDPALPLGRWRSAGRLTEVREDDLRLTDDEAVEIAALAEGGALDADEVIEVNRRVQGWPMALRMALMTRAATDAAPAPRGTPGTIVPHDDPDRLLAAYLAAEVVALMDENDRDVALALSILDQFDPDLCAELVGPEAAATVRRLLQQGMFISVVDERTGATRFHGLFRALLEVELSLRDPARRVQLHRRAAQLYRDRGDLRSAYRHLDAIGELDRAREVIVAPALACVDRGELSELRRLAELLPLPTQVASAGLAVDLGCISVYAQGTVAAGRWCRRARRLLDESAAAPVSGSRAGAGDGGLPAEEVDRSATEAGLRELETLVALFDADLSSAIDGIEAWTEPPVATARGGLGWRFPVAAARAMLASRHPRAEEWIERSERITGPPIVQHATVPTLRAWHAWMRGDLLGATELSEAAVRWLREHDVGPHHWAVDTFVTAGWCRLSLGDLDAATRYAGRASSDADVLGFTWNRMQACYLSARLAAATGDPLRAIRLMEDLEASVPFERAHPYSERFRHLAADAAIALGRYDDAQRIAAELEPGFRRRMLRARLDPLSDRAVDELLADRHDQPTALRLDADVLVALRSASTAPSPQLVALVAECAEGGWVLPFLGLGARAERTLRSIQLDRVHPRLAAALATTDVVGPGGSDDRPGLTAREVSLLELLPTHLTYAEIGERLYLSVNTVKSNLKTLYRKLGASTRAEAVAAGREVGVI